MSEEKPSDKEKGADADDDLDLDDDLADALSEGELDGDSKIDVDMVLNEIDPEFKDDLEGIRAEDFEGVVIEKDRASDEVSEDEKVPSAYSAFIKNLPEEQKKRYIVAAGVLAIMLPLAILIYMGKILPRFELPYRVSMDEFSQKVYTYPGDDVRVPLFDEFRSKAFTLALPKAMINLKSEGESPSYGEFEFFINLRDKEMAETIEQRQSEIVDLLQRILEQVTWSELQTPSGKEKVKKVIRHQLNERLQGNVVVGVYYRSVILQK